MIVALILILGGSLALSYWVGTRLFRATADVPPAGPHPVIDLTEPGVDLGGTDEAEDHDPAPVTRLIIHERP